jgi:TolA-binding protein
LVQNVLVEKYESLLVKGMPVSYKCYWVLYAFLALVGEALPSWARTNTDAQLYLLGVRAYQDGLWDLAIQQLSQYLSGYPEGAMTVWARFLRAEALFQKQQYRAAADLYQEFSRLYPDNELIDRVWYQLGVCNYRLGDYQAAEAAYQQLQQLPQSPFRDKALLGLAESRYAQAKYALAQETYQQIIQQAPAHPDRNLALYGLGWSSFKRGDYNRAITSLQQLMTDFPDDPLYAEALFLLAQAHYELGDYPKAAVTCEEFISQNPKPKQLAQALFSGCHSHYQLGNYSQAIKFFQQLLKLPQAQAAAEARFYLGESQFKLAQYQLALGSYQRLLGGYPNSALAPLASYNMGLCYLKLNQLAKGEAIFEQLIDQFPKHDLASRAWLQLGRLKFERKDYAAAAQAYTKASHSADKQVAAEARYWLGECLANQGQLEGALSEFLKLSKQYAKQKKWVNLARYQTAQIYLRQQKEPQAKKLLVKVAQESTDTQLTKLAKNKLQQLLEATRTE